MILAESFRKFITNFSEISQLATLQRTNWALAVPVSLQPVNTKYVVVTLTRVANQRVM